MSADRGPRRAFNVPALPAVAATLLLPPLPRHFCSLATHLVHLLDHDHYRTGQVASMPKFGVNEKAAEARGKKDAAKKAAAAAADKKKASCSPSCAAAPVGCS